MLSQDDLQALKSVSLVDVMRANGHEPVYLPKGDGRVKFLCPFHHETDGSFMVDQRPREAGKDAGWECFGTCHRRGYGAIALQAMLMGYEDCGNLTDEQMKAVVQRLVDDHGVQIEGVRPTTDAERTTPIAPQDCEFDIAPWTAEHLRALGFSVKLATEGSEDGGARVKYAWGDNETTGQRDGESRNNVITSSRHNANGTTDQRDNKEQPQPLYRCSLDREFWRGRGAERTAQEWGAILEKEFSTYPVSTFITSPVTVKQGGKVSLKIPARQNYPIFAMLYEWGVKKYEPKSSSGNKWYWSRGDGIATKAYGDSVAVKALQEAPANGGAAEWYADVRKDRRHPLVEIIKNERGEKVTTYKMKRLVLCSGPRDAMQVWAATDAHVIWLHSEVAGIRDGVLEEWLCALLCRMMQVAVDVYVCYDLDKTGVASGAAIALENANVKWVRLPREMAGLVRKDSKVKPYKDVTDFVTHFHEIQKAFAPDLRKTNPSEALMRMLKNALTMQFWIDKPTTKKSRDGEERETNVRYVLSVANLLQFLEAKGICSYADERGQRAFYQLSHHNTYHYLDTARTGNQLESVSRTAMLDWIDAHISDEDAPFKANLVNAVYTGKGLDPRTLSTMPSLPINERSWGEDFDYFFFENTAVRVTKEAITPQGYESLPYVTNEECILPGTFDYLEQPWHIIVNPRYEAEKKRHEEISRQCTTPDMRAAENTRWKQYEQLWKYRLVMDRPLEQMPMHFRFLYNQGRIFWEKESFGEKLTATERQMQDMHFINKAHAFGYAITRHRSHAQQLTVHITDYSVSDENKASGRNGKTADIDMLASVRPSSANVAGKGMKNITIEVLFGNVVAKLHTLVCIDELPKNFDFEELFNAGTAIICRTLYKQPVTLRGEDVPKLFIASNKPFDMSGGSVKGRIYPCYTSDYYHAGTDDGRYLDFSPKDEFQEQYGVQEVANNLPDHLLNELRNMLIAFAQFYLQHPGEVIMPPTEARSLRRELYAMTKDSGLTDWLLAYFEDVPDNPHIGQPIPPQEMAISLLDSEEETINNENIEKAKKRITKSLKVCLNRMGIVMDPPVVLNTASYRRNGGRYAQAWMTQLDSLGRPVEKTTKNQWRREVSTGERLPRELTNHVFVHYFYRNKPGCIPRYSPEKGKEYEPDYVQSAPETDPEA